MRKLIYAFFFIVVVSSVLYKASILERQEKREIVSISEEWKEHGKPVDVVEVSRGSLYEISKIAGIIKKGNIIDSEVTPDIALQLAPGQSFEAELKSRTLKGYVEEVAEKRDLLTGLYKTRLRITSKNGFKPGTIVVAHVKVGELRNVLKIPSRAVVRNEDTYCWVVKDGKVSKRKIRTGLESEDEVRVLSGLQSGQQVCVSGLTELSQGDKVRIRKNGERLQ